MQYTDLNPIINKIKDWKLYAKNENIFDNDNFRKENDLDCKLTDGNLNADTIFSLWIPLRFVLVKINGYNKLNEYADINKKIPFCEKIIEIEILNELLPINNELVQKLIKLFMLGIERANVMILPSRSLQARGGKPYFDYMPYFLRECFSDGAFSIHFKNGELTLLEWIEKENLQMFFKDGILKKNNILDLSGSQCPTKGLSIDLNLNIFLDNYIGILEIRKENLEALVNSLK